MLATLSGNLDSVKGGCVVVFRWLPAVCDWLNRGNLLFLVRVSS